MLCHASLGEITDVQQHGFRRPDRGNNKPAQSAAALAAKRRPGKGVRVTRALKGRRHPAADKMNVAIEFVLILC